MSIQELHTKGIEVLSKIEDLPLLLLRVILAYTFFFPGLLKLQHIEPTANFFAQIGIPLPTLNAYMAGSTELVGAVLILFGLFTRYISIPLLFVMFVAIVTVHGQFGFHTITPDVEWANPYINGEPVQGTVVLLQNGYEMVLYFISMLLVLLTKGGGKISLDHILFKRS